MSGHLDHETTDTEAALTQVQHIAYDGVLMIEAERAKGRGGDDSGLPEYIAALEAKVERIANIAESGEPEDGFRATLEGWAWRSADSVESGQLVDLGGEQGRLGEPREVSGTSQAGTTVYLEFNDDQPGASMAYDVRVWVKADR